MKLRRNLWPRSHMLFLILMGGLMAACFPLGEDHGEYEFETEEEADDHWYHSLPRDSWIWQGAQPQVIAAVLERIGKHEGPRLDPELLDSVRDFGPGHWVFEWQQAGQSVERQAKSLEASGKSDLAREHYLEASAYYTIASYPHLKSDSRAMAALDQGRKSYQAAGRYFQSPLQVLDIPHDGKEFRAYLHLPQGEGPFPLVVKSMGSDIVKEQAYPVFSKYLAPKGIAMLSLDIPGIGDSGAYKLNGQTDILHAAAAEALARHPRIDPTRIAVMGVSFGGHSAVRVAFRRDLGLAAAVSICGPLSTVFVQEEDEYEELPRMTTDAVKDRMGLPSTISWTEFAGALPQFSLEAQGLFAQKTQVPILIISTHADPVAPLGDLKPLFKAAPNSRKIILHEPGHCPDRDVRYSLAAAWLADEFKDIAGILTS